MNNSFNVLATGQPKPGILPHSRAAATHDASFDFLTPAAMALLVPSLWLLFRVFKRQQL